MTLTDRTTTPADVLAAVRHLAPAISERAGEIERARRIPRDLLDQLAGAGCFRLLRPRSHGGIEATLPEAIEVYDALARLDGSVAWIVGVGGSTWVDLAGLPRTTFDAVLSDPDVLTAGVFNPTGSASAVDGGYRVSGRWSFASGCEDAEWIYGNCVEGSLDGVPALRTALFRRDEVVIEDTWHVVGLRGTGSHHVRVDDVTLPADRTCVPMVDPPSVDATIAHAPPPSLFALGVASIAVGIARAALDDIIELASGKLPLLAGAPLAADPTFHHDLSAADTGLRAARSLLRETAGELWAVIEAAEPLDVELRARIRAAGAWAAARAGAAADLAYRAGGSATVYDGSTIQRRWRDVQAVNQHFLVRPSTLTTAGAVAAGQDLQVPVF